MRSSLHFFSTGKVHATSYGQFELTENETLSTVEFQMILKLDSGLPKVFLNHIRITLTRERKRELYSRLNDKYVAKIGPGGLTLQIKGGGGTDPLQHQFYYLKLDAPPEPSRKPSMQWNGALVKGLRMVLESRYQSELEDD